MQTKSIRVARGWLARLRQGRASVALVAGGAALIIVALSVPPRSVQAFSSYQTDFASQYPAASGSRLASCVLCHVNGPSAGPRNAYGTDYANNGHSFTAIQNLDSDGDGFSNLEEINALTFPGDASDRPAVASPTPTVTSPPPSPTPTTVLPTATATVAASPTSTSAVPSPMPTLTAPPGSPTPTATAVTSPAGLDLDIRAFRVSPKVEIKRNETDSVIIRLDIRPSTRSDGQGTATVVGMQNGAEVYRANLTVLAGNSRRTRSYAFPAYLPTASGAITWTATVIDGNADDDTATAITSVTASESPDDDRDGDRHDGEHNESSEAQGNGSAGSGGSAADNSAQPTAQPTVNEATAPEATPVVPTATSVAAPAESGACSGTHVVQPGENLFRIGFDCGFSLQQMAVANGIAYPYRIYPGQTLTFP